MRFDNGGKYTDVEFKKCCANNGIKMVKTILEMPQHHRMIERMNKTLKERARSW